MALHSSRALRLPRPPRSRPAASTSPCPHPSSSRHLSRRILLGGRRCLVTASIAPPIDAPIERPEVMVLAESALYRHSWADAASSFYPREGMHFASVDIMRSRDSSGQPDGDGDSLKLLEQTLAEDLSRLGDAGDADAGLPGVGHQTTDSAHAVLIARGPVQCLVAQYFLESLPLAGLVLVDPLLLPEDGRAGLRREAIATEGGSGRWEQSLLDARSMLDGGAPRMYKDTPQSTIDETNRPPLLLPEHNKEPGSSSASELSLLQSLAHNNNLQNARPLRLEPGSMPLLVLYSGAHVYHDHYRICAERTASFHTCGGSGDYYDQVSVLQTKTAEVNGAGRVHDAEWAMRTIYEWYDEVVA